MVWIRGNALDSVTFVPSAHEERSSDSGGNLHGHSAPWSIIVGVKFSPSLFHLPVVWIFMMKSWTTDINSYIFMHFCGTRISFLRVYSDKKDSALCVPALQTLATV